VSASPELPREIRIPHEIVNDDVVIIARWRVAHGAEVRAQDVVAEIETSKTVLDIEAEADGYLEILQPEGAELPIGEVIGRVVASPVARQAPPSVDEAAAAKGGAAARAAGSGVSISKKAQHLIDEHGIDASAFAGSGLVREADVIRHLERQVKAAAGGPDAAPAATAPADARHAEMPSGPAAASAASPTARAGAGYHGSRGLLRDALASASDRGKGLPWLAWNYFWRNWLLGNLVKFAPRGIINVLHRWRGVKMGENCFIDPTATLETAYPENVTLGNDVRITVGAIIMTHIKAPDYQRETGIMPAVLAPVVLEDHSFIGVNAVIMPGVVVGRASVVASGAVVVSNVPEYTMVAGNPAKVVRRFPKPNGR
jgi:acetyltransferase-like isoleucine patch superfamily enzyme